mgnify:CR=1 FL=1
MVAAVDVVVFELGLDAVVGVVVMLGEETAGVERGVSVEVVVAVLESAVGSCSFNGSDLALTDGAFGSFRKLFLLSARTKVLLVFPSLIVTFSGASHTVCFERGS